MKTSQLFGDAAHDYDRTRRQFIPCFDELYGAVLDVLPFEPEAEFRILDLGAGTGLLSAIISQAFPNARFLVTDASPEMLEQARKRFKDDNRFEFEVLDYEHQPIPTGFDAVVSALAIHHTPPHELKDLFKGICEALNRNGIFINLDQALGVTPSHEEKIEAIWQRDARQAGTTEEDLATAIQRMKADKTAPLEFQLQTLREVGFQSVECWYKNFRFVVYSGEKI